MNQQIFDDGSILTFDEDGNVISAVSTDGQVLSVPGADGSNIVKQFASLFNYGGRAAIDRLLYRPTAASAAAAPGTPKPALSGDQQFRLVLLLALGAVLAVKLLK